MGELLTQDILIRMQPFSSFRYQIELVAREGDLVAMDQIVRGLERWWDDASPDSVAHIEQWYGTLTYALGVRHKMAIAQVRAQRETLIDQGLAG